MFFPSIWLFVFPHPPSIYTRRINSFPILLLTSPHLFSPSVPISLDKFNSSFLSFLTLYFLFILNWSFFFFFPLSPDLPSLAISFALGLLKCAFCLYAAQQYSEGGSSFLYMPFRDRAVPPTISIHLPPIFPSSQDSFQLTPFSLSLCLCLWPFFYFSQSINTRRESSTFIFNSLIYILPISIFHR